MSLVFSELIHFDLTTSSPKCDSICDKRPTYCLSRLSSFESKIKINLDMKIFQKKLNELNASEREQLEALLYRYYNSASPEFIANRLEKDYGYDIVLLKKGDIVQGVSYYHLIKDIALSRNRPHYILHFGQAMKRRGYQGNLIWRLGNWYARKNIGWGFLFENVTGIASFISPRAFEHYTGLFPKLYFELNTEEDKKAGEFIENYFNQTRKMSIDYENGFCFDSPDLDVEDITEDWNRIYRAKNEAFNQLFCKHGIIKMENNRIYKMPRHLTACGLRRPRIFRMQAKSQRSFDLKSLA